MFKFLPFACIPPCYLLTFVFVDDTLLHGQVLEVYCWFYVSTFQFTHLFYNTTYDAIPVLLRHTTYYRFFCFARTHLIRCNNTLPSPFSTTGFYLTFLPRLLTATVLCTVPVAALNVSPSLRSVLLTAVWFLAMGFAVASFVPFLPTCPPTYRAYACLARFLTFFVIQFFHVLFIAPPVHCMVWVLPAATARVAAARTAAYLYANACRCATHTRSPARTLPAFARNIYAVPRFRYCRCLLLCQVTYGSSSPAWLGRPFVTFTLPLSFPVLPAT